MKKCLLSTFGAAFSFAFALLVDAPAFAQETETNGGTRTIEAMRLNSGEAIALDGNLDEAVWVRAQPANDFVQIDPDNGRPATERTEVRVAFDSSALYLGVTCFDSEPDKWIGFQRRRDEFLSADDRFMWTIDTFLDARSGYFFEMNPSGLMADSVMGVNGDNRQWDGIWNARVRHSEIGWTIEIQIPFRTLNFNPNSDTWGFNFQRTVRRKNEDSIWMGWARNQGLRRMTNAGHVTGIRDVSQGHGLDIKPYAVFTSAASPGRGQASMDPDGTAGIDFFYNPTPLLRANLTINTDFAQTEVDQRQVNLTRFSLFFPEKRDFFLDGANFFDFGSPTNGDVRVNPFFSRRVGLSAANTPQKIDFGTKITGQMGRQDVGLLHVRTGEEQDDGLIGEDFTVARVKRRMLEQSYVGVLYTRRDPRTPGGDATHTVGLDSRFATNSFLGSENLEVGLWALHATRPEELSGKSAFGGWVAYPNDLWNARFDAGQVDEDFNPSVGFVARRNYRRFNPSLAFSPRPAGHRYIRRFTFNSNVELQTDLDNRLLTRQVDLTPLDVQFHSGDSFAFQISPAYERLDEPFSISPTITLPIGNEYTFTRYEVRGQTANRRVLAFNGSYQAGDFYSGTRTQRVVNLTVRARPGLIVYLTGEWNDIELAEGAFTTRLYRVVGETQFTPFIALVNNVQYDTQSAVLGWQSRFRWIITPGNDLYVVYTHNWLESTLEPRAQRFSTLDKQFATKFLYTYRF
jgi:hypothetical protein